MITIWACDIRTGIECGINQDGDLYFGDGQSGYNLRDTPENRTIIVNAFERYTGRKLDPKEVMR